MKWTIKKAETRILEVEKKGLSRALHVGPRWIF